MATNYLAPFANGEDANIATEEQWTSEPMRNTVTKGFRSGIAESKLINRAIAQGTSAGFSVGQLVADYAGRDATVDAQTLYQGFVEALKTLAQSSAVDRIYPVGSVYISVVPTDPSVLFGTGRWERIGAGRTLIDAGGAFAAGTYGGTDSVRLTGSELPSHSHSGSTNTQGNHSHTRGSMNITGGFFAVRQGADGSWNFDGSFYEAWRHSVKVKSGASDDWGSYYGFNASRSWSGETSWNGNHSHAVYIGATGGGNAFSVRNPYLAVYIWKRVA